MKSEPATLGLASRMLHIDVTVECSKWSAALPDVVILAKDACATAFLNARVDIDSQSFEASIVLADDCLLKGLNQKYRNRNESTNVLSFPTAIKETPHVEIPILLGDIIVSYETAIDEARLEGKSLSNHLCHLIVHGMLHLLGFDHQLSVDADTMEAIEINVLQKLNIANPYEIEKITDVASQ